MNWDRAEEVADAKTASATTLRQYRDLRAGAVHWNVRATKEHMPFPGHRTVGEVRRQTTAANLARLNGGKS